jgi:hypothetical protein
MSPYTKKKKEKRKRKEGKQLCRVGSAPSEDE